MGRWPARRPTSPKFRCGQYCSGAGKWNEETSTCVSLTLLHSCARTSARLLCRQYRSPWRGTASDHSERKTEKGRGGREPRWLQPLQLASGRCMYHHPPPCCQSPRLLTPRCPPTTQRHTTPHQAVQECAIRLSKRHLLPSIAPPPPKKNNCMTPPRAVHCWGAQRWPIDNISGRKGQPHPPRGVLGRVQWWRRRRPPRHSPPLTVAALRRPPPSGRGPQGGSKPRGLRAERPSAELCGRSDWLSSPRIPCVFGVVRKPRRARKH